MSAPNPPSDAPQPSNAPAAPERGPVPGLDEAGSAFFHLNREREANERARAAEVNPAFAGDPLEDGSPADAGRVRANAEPGPEEPGQETGPEASQEPDPNEQAPPEDVPQPEGAEVAEEEADEDPLVEVVVGGRAHEVPFSELVKGYSRNADYTAKTETLATERRELEKMRLQVTSEQTQALAQTQQLAQSLHQELVRTMPSPQAIAELEQNDPGQAALLRQKQQQQQQMIQAAQHAHNAEQQRQLAARIPQERAALVATDPDFEADFEKTYAQVGAWATSVGGISPGEWQQVIDHRMVLITKWAMEHSQGRQMARKSTQRVAKKVAKLPRVRPTVPGDARDTNRDEYDRAIGNLQGGNQSNEDVAAAFAARDRLQSR